MNSCSAPGQTLRLRARPQRKRCGFVLGRRRGGARSHAAGLYVILMHWALTSGCYHYVATERPAEESDVRITFAPPRDVAIEPRGATPVTRTLVTELRGKLTAIRGDTLWLTVDELHDTRRAAPSIENATAWVLRDSSMAVETWSFNGGRTAGTLAGVALVLLLVYAVVGSSAPGY